MRIEREYRLPVALACIVHLLVFIILFVEPVESKQPRFVLNQSEQPVVIHAEVINSRLLSMPEPVIKTESVEQPISEVSEPVQAEPQSSDVVQEHQQAELEKQKELVRRQEEKQRQALQKHEAELQRQAAEEKKAALAREALERKKEADALAEKLKADKLKAEQEKMAAAKAEQLRVEQEKAQQAEAERRKAERAANLAKLAAQLQAGAAKVRQQEAAQRAQQSAAVSGELDKYKALILQAIASQWIVPESVSPQMKTKLLVRLAPGGTVLGVDLIESSGNEVLDRSAKNAVIKASPLPVPSDAMAFESFRQIHLTVRKEGVSSSG